MTDKEALFRYRLRQAEETLRDAEKMSQNNLSPRSILNRTYYVMFYAVLALFIDKDINLKTSKHAGIISIFDREFVHTEKIDKEYSKILHSSFNLRQEGDYRELVEIPAGDAAQGVENAKAFLDAIKAYVEGGK
ncbi:MAG: HEPN domain-containing protein [Syntrophobacterales bacterium]|nr:HEPN domain-containing protein [Syntrophobacterales bacterium]